MITVKSPIGGCTLPTKPENEGLVSAAVAAVAHGSGDTLIPGRVVVDHAERTVFEAQLCGRRVVVKAARSTPDRPGTNLAREVAGLTAAGTADVPVPEIVLYVVGDPSVLVLDHVKGDELRESSPPGEWRAVGRALRRLHDAAPTTGIRAFGGGESWCGWMLWWTDHEYEQARVNGLLAPQVLTSLHAAMTRAFTDLTEPRLRLLHGDCTPYHWLLRDGRVAAALDFGDCGLGDPAYDLTTLTLWDHDRLPDVLDGYGADAQFADHVRRLLVPYQVIRHLAATEWLVQHDIDPSPTVRELARIGGELRAP